ncbi:MAG TPA: hypothetical protein VMV86_04790 [Methanosarcinales archaeon]|nr:hypothetical protein [Methanosarcinales archaeon]
MGNKALKTLAKEEGIILNKDSCPLLEMRAGKLKQVEGVYCDDNCDSCWNRRKYTLKV